MLGSEKDKLFEEIGMLQPRGIKRYFLFNDVSITSDFLFSLKHAPFRDDNLTGHRVYVK